MGRVDDTERVLLFAPHGRDAELAMRIFARAGIDGCVCPNLDALCDELLAGAGCAVLTEESVQNGSEARLIELLAQQPPWSDFPFVVFSARGPEPTSASIEPLRPLGNVAVVDRPAKA